MSPKRYDPLRILYVEEDTPGRDQVIMLLKERFSRVLVASAGEHAWELFQQHQPEIVLTGLTLPDLTGLGLVDRIRRVNPHCHVCILTEKDEILRFLTKAFELDVSTFLIKPLDVSRLGAAVAKVHSEFLMWQDLDLQRNYFRTMLDFHESMILVTDGYQVVEANQRFNEYFAISAEEQPVYLEKVFQHLAEMPRFHEFQEADWDRAIDQERKIIITDAFTDSKHSLTMKATRVRHQPRLKIISFADITEVENERLFYQRLAMIDPLTQIYNRVQFNRSLAEEIQKAKRFHSVFSLVMFDIDFFKKVNDNHGHQLGDTILVELAEMVKMHIREIDIFARFGGEEFIILAPETDLKGAVVLAEKLRKEIETYDFSHGERMTCSFGVSMYKKGDQPDDLIKRMDDRLYRAKNGGRNQVCFV